MKGRALVREHYTSEEALHRLPANAMLPKQCNTTEEQAQTRTCAPSRAQALHHPPLRRTTWTDVALLTRQHNAPHLAQHSHSQTQTRRASQPHRALHPLRSAAPLTWRCTRSERVHCLHIGCIAYVSGARHPPSRISHAIPPAASLHTPQKPWNSNDLMSHSETPTRELHATYGNAGHLRVSGRTHAQSRHRPIRQRPHTTNNQATPTHRRPAHRHTNKQPPQP